MNIAKIIGLLCVSFAFIFNVHTAYPLAFEELPSLDTLGNKEMSLEESMESVASLESKDAYACPLYILMLSQEIIMDNASRGNGPDSIKDVVTGIADVSKNIAEIIQNRITNSSLQFKDQAVKTKLSAYFNDIIKVSTAQIDYLNAKKNEKITMPGLSKQLISQSGEILGTHIYQGNDGALSAKMQCPFQLLTWSEKWQGNAGSDKSCQDCEKIAFLTKELLLQLKKYNLYLAKLSEEEAMEENKKYFESEFRKYEKLHYYNELILGAEALVEYYKTNDKAFLDKATQYRKAAIEKMYSGGEVEMGEWMPNIPSKN